MVKAKIVDAMEVTRRLLDGADAQRRRAEAVAVAGGLPISPTRARQLLDRFKDPAKVRVYVGVQIGLGFDP